MVWGSWFKVWSFGVLEFGVSGVEILSVYEGFIFWGLVFGVWGLGFGFMGYG